MKNYRTFAQLLFLILILAGSQAVAQSTIFNIPTTDTVSPGKAYGEFDFVVQAPGGAASRWYVYNPRLVVGAPHNLEFGVNFPISSTRSSASTTNLGYLQPNAKWKFYENEDAGVAMAVGGLINTPLNSRDGQDSWGLIYALAGKKVKTGDHGPRFHAGPYGILSANQDAGKGPVSFYGPRAGVILGYEQPIQSRISFVADWFSGKNYYGYFTPGISITLPGNGLLNAGYSIGNDSWENSNASKNRSLFLYYGVTF